MAGSKLQDDIKHLLSQFYQAYHQLLHAKKDLEKSRIGYPVGLYCAQWMIQNKQVDKAVPIHDPLKVLTTCLRLYNKKG